MLGIECLHISWNRRGWVLAGYVGLFLLFDALFVAAVVADIVDVGLSTRELALIMASPLVPYMALMFFTLWLDKRERGPSGSLVLDGTTIRLTRAGKPRWSRDVSSFQWGYITDYEGPAIELQQRNGDVFVARVLDEEAAIKWLSATGLDSPSRTFTMRLDDGPPGGQIHALAGSLTVLTLGGIVASLLGLDDVTATVVLVPLFFTCQFLYLRMNAFAVLTVAPYGVEIRRFGRKPHILSWSDVKKVDERRVTLEPDRVRFTLNDDSVVELKCDCGYLRQKALVQHLQLELANSRQVAA